jgi:hypothetical protein
VSLRRSLALVVFTAGCERGCLEGPVPEAPRAVEAPVDVSAAPTAMSPRCARELAEPRAFVAPGSGGVDTLAAACAGDTLAAFVVRGGTLSRTLRSTREGAAFEAPVVVSTGVDRLGPVAVDAVDGPVAWRSPMVGDDESERDDVWAAVLSRRDGGVAVLRGDVLMPAGAAGLGVVAPWRDAQGALGVYASVGRVGAAPSTVRLRVVPGRDEPGAAGPMTAVIPGELKAWEASRRVALARVEEGAAVYLEASWGEGGPRSRRALGSRYALVSQRGVSAGGRSVFLVGEFALSDADGGECMRVGAGVCVRPGAMYLLVAGEAGSPLERIDVAREGVPDAIAARDGAVTALYVARGEQRLARVQVASGAVTPRALRAPEGFGAIDGPTLAACDDGVWLLAEVTRVADEGAAPRSGVTAVPVECLAE